MEHDNRVTGRVFLNGLGKYGWFTVCRLGDSGEFTFESLTIGRVEFSRVEPEQSLQWIYLVSPEAFEKALEGTRWQGLNLTFVTKSRAVYGDMRIGWDLTVNYLIATSDGSGIEISPRELKLEFSI
jgi:hypothetical protein